MLIWLWGLLGRSARRLYFTEIKLGTPPKRYYVQVDTGSDILWVNCISCEKCPRKSGLGVPFPTLYFLFVSELHIGSVVSILM